MNRFRPVLWTVAAAAIVAVGVWISVRNAAEQQSKERAVAEAAILGRWQVTLRGSVSMPFTLVVPAAGTPACLYPGPGTGSSARVSLRIEQTRLRARILDIVRHVPVPPPLYAVDISSGPAALPSGGRWQGHLIGDGNVLVLNPAPGRPPTVLRRLGRA